MNSFLHSLVYILYDVLEENRHVRHAPPALDDESLYISNKMETTDAHFVDNY